MPLLFLTGSALLAQTGGTPSQMPSEPKTLQFVNGQWFDGRKFTSQTLYSVKGLLTRKKPPVVDETIDLHNGFVVPPFGDAHNHMFDGDYNIQQQMQMYLKDGIFYAQTLCNSLKGARSVAAQVNTPFSVDVKYAHGCLTGNNSHPIPTYEALGMGYYNSKDMEAHKDEILKSRRRENDCYYIVDTADDLQKKWPLILAGKPDIIKVILLHSEDYDKRLKEKGYGEGIDPKLLPQIVARAHQAGLRVSAHVDSAGDFHNALVGGVDEMAHMPGYYVGANENVLTYALSPDDAALAAKRSVDVIPTANLAEDMPDTASQEKTRANQLRNLKLLKDAGVKFGIGTDSYGTDALKEALYLSKTGVWSNLEMLKIWCEDTPRRLFPRRKIGSLREGYEANFVVLEADPLANFDNVTKIALRCKQGYLLPPPSTEKAATP